MGDTFKNIFEDSISRTGLKTSDTTLVTKVKGWVNNRYEELANHYPWRWLYEIDYPQQTTAIYTTGTISVTKGSTTVVGTGTTFTAAMTGRKIKVGSFEEEYIVTYVSALQLTLNAAYNGTTNTEATYTLFENEFTMPSNCEEIISIRQYRQARQLEKITIRQLRMHNPSSLSFNQDPDYWCPLELSSDAEYQIQLAPVPYRQILLSIDYKKKITLLSADGDEPLVPSQQRYVLKLGTMADIYYNKLDNIKAGDRTMAMYYAAFKSMLGKAASGDDKIKMVPAIRRRRGLTRQQLTRRYYIGDLVKRI